MDLLKLASEDYTDETARVDLIDGIYRLRRGGFQPEAAKSLNEPVVDVIDLIGDGTKAELIAGEEKISGILEKAELWFRQPTQNDAVFLEWQMVGEPGAGLDVGSGYIISGKRALIYSGALELNQPNGARGAFLDSKVMAKLAIVRHPLWEEVEVRSANDNLSLWGGEWDLTGLATYSGTAPGRIRVLQLYNIGSSYIDKIWFGIRDRNQGISDFDPIWELEDGTNGTDTSDVVDATASGGYKVQTTFATVATMAKRSSIKVVDVLPSGSHSHFVGRYLVLARCKVSSGTCGLQLYYGYPESITARGEEVFISHTGWLLVELGEIQIPPTEYRRWITASWVNNFTLAIYAERVSGSGNLDIDALCLIPTDHLFVAQDIGSSVVPSVDLYTLPDDRHVVIAAEDGQKPLVACSWLARDWWLPRDPGVAVVAAQNETSHVLTDTTDIYLYYYPRWRLYRNND